MSECFIHIHIPASETFHRYLSAELCPDSTVPPAVLASGMKYFPFTFLVAYVFLNVYFFVDLTGNASDNLTVLNWCMSSEMTVESIELV